MIRGRHCHSAVQSQPLHQLVYTVFCVPCLSCGLWLVACLRARRTVLPRFCRWKVDPISSTYIRSTSMRENEKFDKSILHHLSVIMIHNLDALVSTVRRLSYNQSNFWQLDPAQLREWSNAVKQQAKRCLFCKLHFSWRYVRVCLQVLLWGITMKFSEQI
jgi:hypothetical protein